MTDTAKNSDLHASARDTGEYKKVQAAYDKLVEFVNELGIDAMDNQGLRNALRPIIEYGQDSEITALLERDIKTVYRLSTGQEKGDLVKSLKRLAETIGEARGKQFIAPSGAEKE